MSEYKVCVYAIAKNEEKFADRWAKSMYEADEITVLDTGSTDKTVEILSKYPKINVITEEINPWRFDTARNRALEFVSNDADICISTDIDEIFCEGWREGVEKALDEGATQIKYRYVWNFLPDGREGTVFYADKMHKRYDFSWKHPVHEVITYTGKGENKVMTANGVQLEHKADDLKSRRQYLPLLEMSVEEAPDDDRNMHYLAREYMFNGMYEKAIETFNKHLSMKTALWQDERCASLRYIAKCLVKLGREKEAEKYFICAHIQAPHLREPLIELASFLFERKNYSGVIYFINRALEITHRSNNYMTLPEAWNEYPYDILSLAYFFTGDRENALKSIDIALSYAPENERLISNRKFMTE